MTLTHVTNMKTTKYGILRKGSRGIFREMDDLLLLTVDASLLNLTDNLAGARQALDHLLALLPPADGIVALLQQFVKVVIAIHVFQQFALHLILGESES